MVLCDYGEKSFRQTIGNRLFNSLNNLPKGLAQCKTHSSPKHNSLVFVRIRFNCKEWKTP